MIKKSLQKFKKVDWGDQKYEQAKDNFNFTKSVKPKNV